MHSAHAMPPLMARPVSMMPGHGAKVQCWPTRPVSNCQYSELYHTSTQHSQVTDTLEPSLSHFSHCLTFLTVSLLSQSYCINRFSTHFLPKLRVKQCGRCWVVRATPHTVTSRVHLHHGSRALPQSVCNVGCIRGQCLDRGQRSVEHPYRQHKATIIIPLVD